MGREAYKRGTRPAKKAARARRIPVTLRMSPETKRLLDAAASTSGRSQSAEIEFLIEQALSPHAMLERYRLALTDLKRGDFESAARKLGYKPFRTPQGTAWVEPGQHGNFVDPESGQ